MADPGFSRGGGVNPPGGAWTRQIFPKTAWNRKNLDAQGGGGACVPHAPPPRSANGNILKCNRELFEDLRLKGMDWVFLCPRDAFFVVAYHPHLLVNFLCPTIDFRLFILHLTFLKQFSSNIDRRMYCNMRLACRWTFLRYLFWWSNLVVTLIYGWGLVRLRSPFPGFHSERHRPNWSIEEGRGW